MQQNQENKILVCHQNVNKNTEVSKENNRVKNDLQLK